MGKCLEITFCHLFISMIFSPLLTPHKCLQQTLHFLLRVAPLHKMNVKQCQRKCAATAMPQGFCRNSPNVCVLSDTEVGGYMLSQPGEKRSSIELALWSLYKMHSSSSRGIT